jgi:capsular exopolysaccharide synthesis family protein
MTHPHEPPPAPPKKNDGKFSAAVLWNTVRHYPLAFAGVLAAAAVAAVLVWLFLPLPKHTAAAVFHIAGLPPRVINASTDTQADINSYRLAQQVSVKRRLVLNAALTDLTTTGAAPLLMSQPDPLVWLDKYLQVDFRNGPEFMRVYLEGDNPDEMLAVIKAVTVAYKADLTNREKGTQNERLAKIDKAYTDYKGEIDQKEKAIESITKSLKTGDAGSLEMRQAGYMEAISDSRRKLREVEQELEQLKVTIPADNQEVVIPKAVLDAAVGLHREVQEAEKKVAAAQATLNDVTPRTQPDSPLLISYRDAVKAAETARDKIRADVRTGVEAELREKALSDRQQTTNQKKEAYNKLVKQKEKVEDQLKENVDALQILGDNRVRLEDLRKEIGHREKLLNDLMREKDNVKIEKDAPSRVQVSEEPYVAAGIEGYRRLRAAGLAGAGVFVLGFVGLIWWELRTKRITRTDELTLALGLPLLGTLPPWAVDGSLGHGDLVESIDSTRTILLHGQSAGTPLRTLVVTSALPGEGKTSLAGHLAISLTRAGYRTLLVDGDVRTPSAHKLFDLPSGPGLCEVLRNEAEADEVVRDTRIPGLAILPAGTWTLTTRQALVGDRWATVRRQLERRYDYVVVDTSPLLLTTDSLLLARGADGVVLSALLGVSRVGSVAHTNERLASLGARVLGVVVNGAKPAYPGAYGKYAPTPDADATVPLTQA